MVVSNITKLLVELGYNVSYRSNVWTECMVTGHAETWVGSGPDERQATEDLVRRMFPSHASQCLLEQLAAQSSGPILPLEALDEMLRGVNALSEPSSGSTVQGNLTTQLEAPAVVQPPPLSTVVRMGPDARVPKPQTRVEAPRVEAPRVEARPVPVEDSPDQTMDTDEAAELLDALVTEIEDEGVALGTTAPSVMRTQVAWWIFQARSLQEEFRGRTGEGPRKVEERVHRIALMLTHLCKIYWPGNVMALNVTCTPTLALEGIAHTPRPPTSWAEAVTILSAHMESLENRRPIRDETGWLDRAWLRPGPSQPDAVVKEARKLIEKVTGPLGSRHLDELRGRVYVQDVAAGLEDLVLAAHLLRWTRQCCTDPKEWGRAMGALRWCSKEAREVAGDLAKVIDEDFSPSRGWAELLGRDPEVNRRKRVQREILEQLPTPAWPEEDLLVWLSKAFSAFNNPQIAKMAELVRDEILLLSKSDFADADRSTRSRLHKLQSILRAGAVKAELPKVEELVTEDEEVEASEDSADPADRLLSQVRERTADKRILFVTNRDDVRLKDDLERDLKCEVTLRNGGSSRLMKAVLDSVDAKRFDIVCMATGFNNHNADATLCRKAKIEGIPYVRVQKGRRASTIRALARAFNLTEESKREDSPVASEVR